MPVLSTGGPKASIHYLPSRECSQPQRLANARSNLCRCQPCEGDGNAPRRECSQILLSPLHELWVRNEERAQPEVTMGQHPDQVADMFPPVTRGLWFEEDDLMLRRCGSDRPATW